MKKESFQVEVRDQDISGKLFLPKSKGNFPVVVLSHERKSSKSKYASTAEKIAEEGVAVASFDFRGHGESKGSLGKQTLRDGLKDIRAVYNFLEEDDRIDEDSLGMLGRGFGGYLSALFSKEQEVGSLVLSSPAVYKDVWMDLMYRNFPLKDVEEFRSQINFVDTKSIQAIRKYTGDLMVVLNGDDEQVPETVARSYYDNAIAANQKEIKTIEGAKHNLENKERKKEFNDLVSDWFSKSL